MAALRLPAAHRLGHFHLPAIGQVVAVVAAKTVRRARRVTDRGAMVAAESTDAELQSGTQVLGRYSIVGKLAQGGMAEVYLARQVGPAGYQKLVVIKRVRPHLANDADFVGMFVNEARLAAMINHPNVVQIFDLGDEPRPVSQGGGKDWFLAMEYLDGRDMLQVGRACRAHNKAVPFDVTARIIADACAGLDHAHGLKGPDGKSLDLVHRDMSPENVLITFEGQVKVVDFGIAKASDNLIKTQAGQIKGKLGYVAPEAILGKPVDARADVFAIGATLYLFLSGRPAFSGSNPMEIFERSLKPPTPPREVNSRVPEALDAVCMKALAQDRDKRYRSAGEVRAALDAYLQSTGRPLGPVQLAQFMKILFPPDKDPVRQRVEKLLAEHPAVEVPRRNSLPPQGVPAPLPVTMPLAQKPAPVVVPDDEDNDKTNIVPPKDSPLRVESVPDPITINTAVPKPRSPTPSHLRSVGLPPPRALVSAEMTHEEIDMRAAREATLQSQQRPVPAASIDIDDIDVDDLAAAVADAEDDDLVTVEASRPRVSTTRSAIDDVASALPPGYSGEGDIGPPPPMEASGAVRRPPPPAPPPSRPPPPAFDLDAPTAASSLPVTRPSAPPATLAPPATEPAFAPPPQSFSAPPQSFSPPPPQPAAAAAAPAYPPPSPYPPAFVPVESVVEAPIVAPAGPSLGLRLAMLGFGALTGLVILVIGLAATGHLGRLLG
jgi:serine/threonine-protein kinase